MVIWSCYIQAASAINNSICMFFYSIHNEGLQIIIIIIYSKTIKKQQAKENTKVIQQLRANQNTTRNTLENAGNTKEPGEGQARKGKQTNHQRVRRQHRLKYKLN